MNYLRMVRASSGHWCEPSLLKQYELGQNEEDRSIIKGGLIWTRGRSKDVDDFTKERCLDLHFFWVMEEGLTRRPSLLSDGLRESNQRWKWI